MQIAPSPLSASASAARYIIPQLFLPLTHDGLSCPHLYLPRICCLQYTYSVYPLGRKGSLLVHVLRLFPVAKAAILYTYRPSSSRASACMCCCCVHGNCLLMFPSSFSNCPRSHAKGERRRGGSKEKGKQVLLREQAAWPRELGKGNEKNKIPFSESIIAV